MLHTNVERTIYESQAHDSMHQLTGEHLCIIRIQVVRHRVDEILDVIGVGLCSELRRTDDGTLRNTAHQSG